MCLGIPRLTELSGYSRSHLARLVRQYYGCSLQELIIQLRLEEAYKQIILTKDSPEEIAYKVGYSSFSHFQKVFKKTFGVTPAVLRKTRATRTV
jgi:AraC-like DNA-binding protein